MGAMRAAARGSGGISVSSERESQRADVRNPLDVALAALCTAVGMAALISLRVSGRLRGQDAGGEESEP